MNKGKTVTLIVQANTPAIGTIVVKYDLPAPRTVLELEN